MCKAVGAVVEEEEEVWRVGMRYVCGRFEVAGSRSEVAAARLSEWKRRQQRDGGVSGQTRSSRREVRSSRQVEVSLIVESERQ